MEQCITKPLLDKISLETSNYNKLEKSQQQHMGSKLCTTNYQILSNSMDGSSLMATREKEYKENLLLGFIACKSLNCKDLRTNIF